MLKNVEDPKELRQILLSLLSTSGTLAGISLALVSIINIKASNTNVESIADDIFLFSSLSFLVVCYLIFFAMRSLHTERLQYWVSVIDMIYLFALTLLVLAGFVVVYALV